MNYDKLNGKVKSWQLSARRQLVGMFDKLGIKHRSNSPSSKASVKSISTRSKKRYGAVERISFKFPRHMVFVHKGVGRGTKAAEAGSTKSKRKAKEWYNPVMDEQVPKLADTVAEEYGDLSVNAIQIQ